jgi:uncharacterized small protein (DUF1192 family)
MQFLDETPEEEQRRENAETYFGKFSSGIRKQLLSKNIKKPENIYDILYTQVRKDLLAKNKVTFNVNLDEQSKQIRNNLLSKQIRQDIDLERDSESVRKNLLSKNKLIQSTIDLEETSDSVRQNLLSKNNEINNLSLEDGSNQVRHNLLSKNKSEHEELDKSGNVIRHNLLSKNEVNTNISNIDDVGKSARHNLLSKNNDNTSDIDKDSKIIRDSLLSKNEDGINSSIENQSTQFRDNLLSKNKVNDNNDIESQSEQFRHNLLSKNNKEEHSIEDGSTKFRNDLLNKNRNVEQNSSEDIEKQGEKIRQNLLAKNSENENLKDIDKTGDIARQNLLSKNEDGFNNNIDRQSVSFRENLLSKNDDTANDIDKQSQPFRDNLLSKNDVGNNDIDKQSEAFRSNLLSKNKEDGINVETNSQSERNNLLSKNVPLGLSPETNSQSERNNLLSKNVPLGLSPETNSQTERNNLLSKNVNQGLSPETNSQTERNNLLSKNVALGLNPETNSTTERNNLLSKNVIQGLNPETGANDARNNLLSKNTSQGLNPETGSEDVRNSLLSKNTENTTSLDSFSNDFRDNLLSKNAENTTALDNLSNNFRHNLLSKNKDTVPPLDVLSEAFRHKLLSRNSNHTIGKNIVLPGGTSQYIGISNLELLSAPIREAVRIREKLSQKMTPNNLTSLYSLRIDVNGTPLADTTDAAQRHNIEQNTFALRRYSQGSSQGLVELQGNNNDGFQQLIQNTIGSLHKETQVFTNSTPANIISANHGQYFSTGPEELLKPGTSNYSAGTAESMMSQIDTSDVIERDFYKNGTRGVQHIINTIKNSNNGTGIQKNFNSQSSNSFIVGFDKKQNTYKKSYSRYTIANPYQPNKDAGALEFRITNYSIPDSQVRTMSFPPYIKSFSNSDSATWNPTTFLGRPEPIYTYGSSSRKGSVSFYILTDYAQTVDMGYDYVKGEIIQEKFDKDFTNIVDAGNARVGLQVIIKNKRAELAKEKSRLGLLRQNDVYGIANVNAKIAELNSEISSLEQQLKNLDDNDKNLRLYSEYSKDGNIYKDVMAGKTISENGEIVSSPQDIAERINKLRKDLIFQPAFFSGDKIDFLNRMEFIAKLTRPSRNNSLQGFSFISPPVAHLHLSSWFNHDVIIDSVDYDYSDTVWTTDGLDGRIQPMFAVITLNFSIIGTYGGNPNDDVPLSTDIGGFFSRRVVA